MTDQPRTRRVSPATIVVGILLALAGVGLVAFGAIALLADFNGAAESPPTVTPSPTPTDTPTLSPATYTPTPELPTPTPPDPTATATETAAPPGDPSIVRVRPAETNEVLANPGIGWQDVGDIYDPRFPQTVAYQRYEWVDLNPDEGVYDWGPVESLRGAGLTFSFGIKTASSPPWGSGQAVPQWAVDLGAELVDTTEFDMEATEPVYHSCVFLEQHGRFIEAMRERYDGDPGVEFIDIRSYGYYGEWHTPQYDQDVNSLDYHARTRIAEMYIGGSGSRPCTMPDGSVQEESYSYPGFQHTQLLVPYTPFFEQTLLYMFEQRGDLGIRHDALGSQGHQDSYREDIGHLVEQVWRTEPIVFEFSADGWTDESLRLAIDFVREMHASIVHDNFPDRGSDALLRKLLNVLGYRFVLRELVHPATISPGGEMTLEMAWENVGSAPPYKSYPLVVYLTGADGSVAATWQLDANVRTWLPGPVSVTQTVQVPETLAPGTYDLRLALVWPGTDQAAIALAIDGRDSAGRYLLSSIQVSN